MPRVAHGQQRQRRGHARRGHRSGLLRGAGVTPAAWANRNGTKLLKGECVTHKRRLPRARDGCCRSTTRAPHSSGTCGGCGGGQERELSLNAFHAR